MPVNGSSGRADVELRLPGDSAYVSVLRTTTAGLAARLDFTLDDIEDLRIAVGEACAIILEGADPGAELVSRFWLDATRITIAVSSGSAAPAAVDEDSFAWQVLTTLATEASARGEGGRFEITLVMEATPLGVPL